MRLLSTLVAAFACLGFASAGAFGQINIPGLGGNGGSGNRGNNNNSGNANNFRGFARGEGDVKAKAESNNNSNNRGINIGGRDGINIEAGKNGLQIDSQRNKDRENFGKNNNHQNSNHHNNGHHDDLTKRSRIGDGNWDKFGIGRLDDSRYRNSSNNQWRYKRYGDDWFYWTPAGYWMFYGNNRWNRYDPDTYATYYYGDSFVPQQQPQVVPANFNGPYYEDSNGFYYLNGSQRVYDPTIRRVVTATTN